MILKWKKLGENQWVGEGGESGLRYVVNRKPFPLGGTRFYVTYGTDAPYFASCSTLKQAQGLAQEDAVVREKRQGP